VGYLHTVGEAGTVKLRTKTTPKLSNQGETCMYLGPAVGHNVDTHIMWNPRIGGVHCMRDVVWLRRMYYSKPAHTDELVLHIPDAEGGSAQPKVGKGTNQEEDDGWTTVTHGGRPTQTGDDQVPATTQVMAPSTMTTRSGQTVRPLAWMESFNVQQSGSTNSERLKAMRDIADCTSEDEEEEATTEEILEAEEVDAGEMEEMALISVTASPMGIKESWARDKYTTGWECC
jgi:hypothetical protein